MVVLRALQPDPMSIMNMNVPGVPGEGDQYA